MFRTNLRERVVSETSIQQDVLRDSFGNLELLKTQQSISNKALERLARELLTVNAQANPK